jgi:diguanylate cyclase (GGDEF)-like protein
MSSMVLAADRWWLVALASIATLVTLWLLAGAVRASGGAIVRRRRHDRRERRDGVHADPGEALALVGDALAATHNPRALLPVILEVVIEATGARGGRVREGGEDVSWMGEIGAEEPSIVLELARAEEGETTLSLYAPEGGFREETRRTAEWLASQAAIALENAKLHHLVQRQATTDDLTGLVNRRRFIEALESEIVRANTFGSPLSVVLGDLDHFKLVNDRFGHHTGDEVLRQFAELVRQHLREVDVPGRIGGEEFAIVLPETDAAGAVAVAERVRRSLRSVRPMPERGSAVTASFGVAQLALGETGDEVLRRADVALYRAKGEGRNTVRVEPGGPESDKSVVSNL